MHCKVRTQLAAAKTNEIRDVWTGVEGFASSARAADVRSTPQGARPRLRQTPSHPDSVHRVYVRLRRASAYVHGLQSEDEAAARSFQELGLRSLNMINDLFLKCPTNVICWTRPNSALNGLWS